MKKILVIGPCGSGKSYFSEKIGTILNIPVYHLDNIWWTENKENISKSDFDRQVREILTKDEFILDGLYTRTLVERAEYADTIFYLDFELDTCISNIKKRTGTKRKDLPWIESKKDEEELIKWVTSTFKEKKCKIVKIIKNCTDKEIVCIKSREEMDNYLKELKYVPRETFTEGVLFDFNGTLYFDDDINDITWKMTIEEMTGRSNVDDIVEITRGMKNSVLIRKVHELIGKEVEEDKIEYWSNRKEEKYRQYCVDHHRNKMPDGAEELLDYLKDHGIPVNLCTNSIRSNVEFYFQNVGLYRWFDINRTVYDTGEYKDKSEMYPVAAKRAGVEISKTIIFEDSKASIEDAIRAGCKKIVALQKKDHGNHKEIIAEIKDYKELDYRLLNLKNRNI